MNTQALSDFQQRHPDGICLGGGIASFPNAPPIHRTQPIAAPVVLSKPAARSVAPTPAPPRPAAPSIPRPAAPMLSASMIYANRRKAAEEAESAHYRTNAQ